MGDLQATALTSIPAVMFIALLGWWLWTRPLKIRPLTDSERAELLMNRNFQRVWYIADQALVDRDVLGRRRVEEGWMQVARERRRIQTGRNGYGKGSTPIYYHFPPVINVRVRHDIPLELGLDLRSGYERPFYATADEPWIPDALLSLGARDAINATSWHVSVYANDEEVVVELGAGASQEQLAWATKRARALAGLMREAKRQLPRTRPVADLLNAMRDLATRYDGRLHDDSVSLAAETNGCRISVGVTRERYGCFKLAITTPFPAPLPGKFYVTADHRDALDKLFGKNDATVGDASFDERFVLRGEMPAMTPLLTAEVRSALVPLALTWFVEIDPGALTVKATGLDVARVHRAIEQTLIAAPVVAARVAALLALANRTPFPLPLSPRRDTPGTLPARARMPT